MIYIILAAGMALAVYGVMGLRQKDMGYISETEPVVNRDQFREILIGSEIVHRLETIEEKIDALGSMSIHHAEDTVVYNEPVRTQFNVKPEEVNDLNRRILRMKNDGMDIEEIASSMGIMKGEVLLRLGMKR